MSDFMKPEKTIIDGKVYFDIEKDAENNQAQAEERARLIQKMKDAKKSGMPTQRGEGRVQIDFHCDDVLGFETLNDE